MLPASSRLTSVLLLPNCLDVAIALNHGIHTSTTSADSTATSASPVPSSSAQHGSPPVSVRTTKGRSRHSPAVLAYFQQVKEWNKQMSLLKTQWRTELLTQLQQQQQQLQQQRITLQPSTQHQSSPSLPMQQGAEAEYTEQQRQQALSMKLRRAEIELAVAQIKLHKAHKFKQWQARIEARKAHRREALLEASRHWIRREELEDRILQALDNPASFGFVSPVPDATKAL